MTTLVRTALQLRAEETAAAATGNNLAELNVLGEQEWRGNSCVLPNILSRCRSGFFRTWKLKTEILGKTGD